jgi:predicted kinase
MVTASHTRVQADRKELDAVKVSLEAARMALESKAAQFEAERKGKDAEWSTLEKQLDKQRAEFDKILVTAQVGRGERASSVL